MSIAPGRMAATRIDSRTRVANMYSLQTRHRHPGDLPARRTARSCDALLTSTSLAQHGARIRLTPSVPGRGLVVDREVALLPIPTEEPGGSASSPSCASGPSSPGSSRRSNSSGPRRPRSRDAISKDQDDDHRARPHPRGDPPTDGRGREGRGDLAATLDLGAHLPAAHRRLHDPGRREQPVPGGRHSRAGRAYRRAVVIRTEHRPTERAFQFGAIRGHGRSCSSVAASPSSIASPPGWATSWTDSGRPSRAWPAGTTMAGQPATFHGAA